MTDLNMVKTLIVNLCNDNKLPVPKIELSGRIKRANAYWYTPSVKYPNSVIRLGKDYFARFDWESVKGTVVHEFCHHFLYWKARKTGKSAEVAWKECGHNTQFKELCLNLGGTMNESLAGEAYASCATNDFVYDNFKWSYVCSGCGKHLANTRRAYSRRELTSRVCSTCGTSLAKADKNVYGV